MGKVVEVLFQSALTDTVDLNKRTTAEQLKTAVEQIQGNLHSDFNAKLTSLLPTFNLFGYPALSDPGLVTETSLDVDKLLNDHTKVRYVGVNGMTLPETYNGLGVRNLVYMLLQLLRFFREYQATPTQPACINLHRGAEAHLHPQMQEVFIRQLDQITSAFVSQLNENRRGLFNSSSPLTLPHGERSAVRGYALLPLCSRRRKHSSLGFEGFAQRHGRCP